MLTGTVKLCGEQGILNIIFGIYIRCQQIDCFYSKVNSSDRKLYILSPNQHQSRKMELQGLPLGFESATLISRSGSFIFSNVKLSSVISFRVPRHLFMGTTNCLHVLNGKPLLQWLVHLVNNKKKCK